MMSGNPAVVRAEGVAYGYGPGATHLRPTDLRIEKGQLWHVQGPSGSGKSTLARCLTGLIPHLYHGRFAGRVAVGEMETSTTPLWRLAEYAGLVFQNPAGQMLTETVEDEIVFGLENLGLDAATIEQRTAAALAQFELTALRHRTPQTLSGGEQQKLALAAILARRPSLLVLDEPLSMLDSTAATELVTHLAGLPAAGQSVILCEHRGEHLAGLPDLHQLTLSALRARPSSDLPAPLGASSTETRRLMLDDVTVQLGGRVVLDRVSLTLESGQLVAVVGRNGAGKTTLLRALAGLQRHEGRIHIHDQRPDFGLVYQNAELQLFNPTVQQEMRYRLSDPDEDLFHGLLALLGLTEYAETPPLLLSEGEKKRVALAAILMRKPRHGVLLDEPSLGQDLRHKEILVRLSRALSASGQFVIMTTHDLWLAARADRILLMGPGGGIEANGTPAEVWQDGDAWRRAGLILPAWARTFVEERPC